MTARVIPLHPEHTSPPTHRHTGPGRPRRARTEITQGFFDPYRAPDRPAARRRSPRGPVIAAAIVTVLVGGIGLTHHLLTRAPDPVPAVTSTAPSGAEEVSWEVVQGVYIPTSQSAGPTRNDGGVIGGFADTDLGAALAAAHIVYRASAAPGPQVFTAALAEQVTGPGAAALRTSVRADYDPARTAADIPDGAPLPAGSAVFLGYRVSAMPDGNRAVQIIEQARDGDGIARLVAFDVVVTRAPNTAGGQDWKVIAPTAGTWSSVFTPLPDLPDDVVLFTPTAPATPAVTTATGEQVGD